MFTTLSRLKLPFWILSQLISLWNHTYTQNRDNKDLAYTVHMSRSLSVFSKCTGFHQIGETNVTCHNIQYLPRAKLLYCFEFHRIIPWTSAVKLCRAKIIDLSCASIWHYQSFPKQETSHRMVRTSVWFISPFGEHCSKCYNHDQQIRDVDHLKRVPLYRLVPFLTC